MWVEKHLFFNKLIILLYALFEEFVIKVELKDCLLGFVYSDTERHAMKHYPSLGIFGWSVCFQLSRSFVWSMQAKLK